MNKPSTQNQPVRLEHQRGHTTLVKQQQKCAATHGSQRRQAIPTSPPDNPTPMQSLVPPRVTPHRQETKRNIRHHTGPKASVPLQHHAPPNRVISQDPDLLPLAVNTTTTQHAAASPHLPLESTSLSSPRRNTACGGLATSASALHVTDLFLLLPSEWWAAPPPCKVPIKPPSHHRWSTSSR